MQRAKRDELRRRADLEKGERAARARKKRDVHAWRVAMARTDLARSRVSTRRGWGELPPALCAALERKASRLFVPEYKGVLGKLARYPWLRAPEDWEPRGKSRETVFQSLLAHLFARYETPKFLWSGFHSADDRIVNVVLHVARGGSLYEHVSKGFPVPLTRKMCHAFLETTSEYTFLGALRRTQVREFGGTPRLFASWMNTEVARALHSKKSEEFWATVLRFFANNPMVDHEQIGPLIDYIAHRRRENPDFSMKGRTVVALLRGMTEWHGDLAKVRGYEARVFERSGFKERSYDYDYRDADGGKLRIHWDVKEILHSRDLAEEGRVLHHCVYSYAYRIKTGGTSIWSLRRGDERVTTIQVENQQKAIVQYRGERNVMPNAREFQIIKAWADDNGLTISGNGW